MSSSNHNSCHGTLPPLDMGKLFEMMDAELRRETPAPTTSQFSQEVAYESQKRKQHGYFVSKNKNLERNLIGIIVKSRAVFEKVCHSPRVVGCDRRHPTDTSHLDKS